MREIMNYDEMKEFMAGDDLDFYERYLMDLTGEELERFFLLNPDFMKEYNMYKERLQLLRDKMYREILRGIFKRC